MDKADPLRTYHQRQINDQATPVVIYSGGGEGGGGGPIGVQLVGSKVTYVVVGGSLPAQTPETDVLVVPSPATITRLTWTTNRNTETRMWMYQLDADGVPSAIADSLLDGSAGYGWTVLQMINNRNPFFDVLEYDTVNNRFKLALRHPMPFAHGFKLAHKNDGSFARYSRFDIGYGI